MTIITTIYIILCLIIAYVGSATRLTFFGTLIVAFLFTPMIAFIIIVLLGDKKEVKNMTEIELKALLYDKQQNQVK